MKLDKFTASSAVIRCCLNHEIMLQENKGMHVCAFVQSYFVQESIFHAVTS